VAPGAPRPVNRAWIKKHVIDHVIDGNGCAQYGIAWSSSMPELRLRLPLNRRVYLCPNLVIRLRIESGIHKV